MEGKRKKALLLLGACLLVTGALLWLDYLRYSGKLGKERPLNITLTKGENAPNLKEGRNDEILLCYQGAPLPYDEETGICYLPQDLSKEGWQGSLSVNEDGYEIFAPFDPFWENWKDAIREGHVFTIRLVGKEDYLERKLVATGMPAMAVETFWSEKPEPVEYEEDPDRYMFESGERGYGTVTVWDPGIHADEYTVVRSGIRYNQKGVTSASLRKKSYSIDLINENGADENISLLGMRKDDDWKLNSLGTDVNMIREKAAVDLWEKIADANETVNETGPRMEYVDLFLDHRYLGVYGLVEPVDAKKLGLGADDLLYKMIGWEAPEDEKIQESVDREWKVQQTIRIRYPKEIEDYEYAWYPIRDYADCFFRENEEDYDQILSKAELSNLTDMWLFVSATSASDNCYKNTYYAANLTESGEYVMRQIPWDLDYTFGNRYQYREGKPVQYDADERVIYAEASLQRLKQINPDKIGPYVLNRWRDLRSGILSTESVLEMLQGSRDYLMDSGAYAREKLLDEEISSEIEYLLEYEERRLEWLDEYLEEWASRPDLIAE